jgi:hypothetical protein
MSIDYTTRLCYGMVIPSEIAEKIRDRVNDFSDEASNDFFDKYFLALNSWGDGWEGSFLGFATYLGEDCTEILVDDDLLKEKIYTPDDMAEFQKLYELFHLNDFIQGKTRKSIITFIS